MRRSAEAPLKERRASPRAASAAVNGRRSRSVRTWSAPRRASNAGTADIGHVAPGGLFALDDPDVRGSRASRPGRARPARPPSQSPFSSRIARAADLIELGQRLCLGADVARSPERLGGRHGGDRLVEVVVRALGRVVHQARHQRERQDRRVQQDDRGSDQSRRPAGGRPPSRRSCGRSPAARPGPRPRRGPSRRRRPPCPANRGRPVQWPGPPVAGQVGCEHAATGRRQRRPHPPPDRRATRSRRGAARVAAPPDRPRQGGERDPGRLDDRRSPGSGAAIAAATGSGRSAMRRRDRCAVVIAPMQAKPVARSRGR